MSKSQITINGQEVGVAYCYATEIAFTRYTGVSVDEFDTKNPEHHIYIIIAAIIAYYESQGKKAPVKDTDLMYHATPTELTTALTEIFELRKEWYDIPKGAERKDEEPADEDGKEKNA